MVSFRPPQNEFMLGLFKFGQHGKIPTVDAIEGEHKLYDQHSNDFAFVIDKQDDA